MRIRTVAQVHEHMLLVGERRLPDPRRALAAHLRVHVRPPLRRERRHVVTADPRQRARALRQRRRRVVRTARAEVRLARVDLVHAGHSLLRATHLREISIGPRPVRPVRHPPHQRRRDIRRRQRCNVRQQRRAIAIPLALHNRPLAVRQVIQHILQLLLDHRPLVLDHQHALEPAAEIADRRRLQRPRHRDLEDRHAQVRRLLRRHAHRAQRLIDIARSLPRHHNAQLFLLARQQRAIEPIGPHKRLRRRNLEMPQPRLFPKRRVANADAHAALRQHEIRRPYEIVAMQTHLNHGA